MRGYPKHLNSKKDFEIALAVDKKRTKKRVKRLLENREHWFEKKRLQEGDKAVEDDKNRVIEETGDDGVVERVQLEKRRDPNAKLTRLGFTVKEAEAFVK